MLQGSSMTDTSPLIKIKASLSALRSEVKVMDLHIGVVGHAVMQSKVHHKQMQVAAAKGGHKGGKKSAGEHFEVSDDEN
jgi:hypothetical protein